MAHLYLHIPYCHQACHYCDFTFSTNLNSQSAFVSALIKEIEISSQVLSNSKLETIYLGGGTPSILTIEELARIFDQIRKYYELSALREVTLEMNPEDISLDFLRKLQNYTPVNRLSVGIQSLNDEVLMWMNRNHNVKSVHKSIDLLRQAGFHNYTIDLIYGHPKLSDSEWRETLKWVLDHEIPHLSTYSLTVEPKTVFDFQQRKLGKKIIDDTASSSQMQILNDELVHNNYIRYEISNSSLSGYEAVHNSAYWSGREYLGLGPSAHSYDGNQLRTWVKPNIHQYITSLKDGMRNLESETLTDRDLYNEYLMVRLRTQKGISWSDINDRWGSDELRNLKKQLSQLDKSYIKIDNEGICLTYLGWNWMDQIMVQLMR